MAHGFFRRGRERGGDDVGGLTNRVFELARFWKVSPHEVLGLPLSQFYLWEEQAVRINDLEKEKADG